MSLRRLPVVLALAFLTCAPAAAQGNFAAQRAEWNRPVEPFTIFGNVHYVGTAQIAAYLVTSPEGHVLIDGVMEESAGQIADNIRRLGFRVEDVRYLLINHAHWDHAGGLAELKRLTGAQLVASRADAPDLAVGFNRDRDDTAHFPPVEVDRVIGDGEQLRLGPITLTARLTPGHTQGCTSWSTNAQEGAVSHSLLFACSLTVADERLVGNERYPGAAADFERTYAALREVRADIFLGFHTGGFGFDDKRRRRLAGDTGAFVDPGELARQVDRAEAAFREELARQQGAAAPAQ